MRSRPRRWIVALVLVATTGGCASPAVQDAVGPSSGASSSAPAAEGPNDGDALPAVDGFTYVAAPAFQTAQAANLEANDTVVREVLVAGFTSTTVTPSLVGGLTVTFYGGDVAAGMDEAPDGVARLAAGAARESLPGRPEPASETLSGRPAEVLVGDGYTMVIAYLGGGILAQIGSESAGDARAFAEGFLAVA